MTDTYRFTVKDLAVGYRGKALLQNISVDLRPGQILTLIGPNGAGKSTILKTITRQLAPIAGMVYIEGKELRSCAASDLARQMSLVLTERVRPEMMTCYDVAAMGRYPYTGRFGSLTPADHAIVRSALRRVRAEDLAQRDFGQISDGQRQRVLLARALCQEPDILVLDEPTSFLDIRHKIDLLDILLEEARTRRLTVILSLHEIDLAEKVSDLILCVQGEEGVCLGTPAEVFTDDGIAALYGLERGSYLTRRGSIELARSEGAAQVFVIGGAGYGLPHYRALQKRRIPFAAGILWQNDLEYDVAAALATEVVSLPAFEPIHPDTLARAKQVMAACKAVLDAGAPLGELNRANGELITYAQSLGLPIIRRIDELD